MFLNLYGFARNTSMAALISATLIGVATGVNDRVDPSALWPGVSVAVLVRSRRVGEGFEGAACGKPVGQSLRWDTTPDKGCLSAFPPGNIFERPTARQGV